MTNYIYNRMNAQEIAQRIIENEEAYLKADLSSLSFEDKCRFALHHTVAFHPLCRLLDISELCASIYPELLKRAEDNDGFALYCLAALFTPDLPRKQTRLEYLERAVKADSVEARLHSIGRKPDGKAKEILRLACETAILHSHGKAPEWYEHMLYQCHNMLANCETDPDLKSHYQNQTDKHALKLVLEGKYYYLCHLTAKEEHLDEFLTEDDELIKPDKSFSDEKLFWKTVSFTVDSYFYNRGARHLGDHLAIRLIRGIGCECDVERAKQIYLDAIFGRSYDRGRLIKLASLEGDLDEREKSFRTRMANGRLRCYWQLILIALLRGDRKQAEAICDEVFAHGELTAMQNIPKAYHTLLRAAY